jgi:hypothetical protein
MTRGERSAKNFELALSMIRKSGRRFSENIMLDQEPRARSNSTDTIAL